jgi:hypothetical protein
MKKILTHFLLLMLLSLAAFTQRAKVLGIIGSSTAAGYMATDSAHSFAHLVVRHYDSLGHHVVLDNIAEAGRNCYQGMPSGYIPPPGRDAPWPQRNITKVLSYHPDVVLVCYPSNNYDVYSVKEILFCLETIRKASLKAGVPCYIATTQPRSQFPAAIRDTLRRLKDSILRRYGHFALDFWTGLDSSNNMMKKYYSYGDGVHPNNAGHALLAKRVIAANVFGVILPVKLANFSTTLKNNQPLLQWLGEDESPDTRYLVERSPDGGHFQPLAEIRGYGDSISANYSFTDRNPEIGFNYYRLKVTDGSNTYYSTVKSINILPLPVALRLFPVPAFGDLTVEIQSGKNQSAQVELVTSTGLVLRSFPQKLDAQKRVLLTIPLNGLSQGTYFIRLKTSLTGNIVKAFMKE